MALHAFGRDTGWLAFANQTQDAVVAMLGLGQAAPVGWELAIDAARRSGSIAVTPPLPGVGCPWVLATGVDLCDGRIDIAALSRASGGQVQHFAAHDRVQFHLWRRALDGWLTRSFVWSGEYRQVLDWVGQPDAVERLVGVPPHGATDDATAARLVRGGVGTRAVMRIARQWSIDPTSLAGPAPALPRLSNHIQLAAS